MEELEEKKQILHAIKEAIANIKLENDFNDLEINQDMVDDINNKVMRLNSIYDMGRLHL